MKILFTNKRYIRVASVVFMLVVWKVLSVYFNSALIVPSPGNALVKVVTLFFDADFITVVGITIVRGVVGFIISGVLGIAIGIMAGVSCRFNAFISPVLVTIRSVPVISIILLALIWFNPDIVPVFIAMLTMFPFICTNVSDGIRSVNIELIQMARFYRIGKGRIVREVYIPAIMPFIISGASSAMGIGWRAVIIGEVLSQPQYGIGTKMQEAQTYLNVESVIAWTIIAVFISYGFEKLIRWGERKMVNWRN